MELQELHINNWVKVLNNTVAAREKILYKNPGNDFLQAAYEALDNNYPKFYKMDTLSKTGILATYALLQGVDVARYQPEQTAIVLTNRNGSIEADTRYYQASLQYPSPALFVYTLPNIVIGEISIRYGFKGENAFFISENFDAAWLHFYVNDLFAQTGTQACICGWADVVEETATACLFWVTKEKSANAVTFTPEQMQSIFNKKI